MAGRAAEARTQATPAAAGSNAWAVDGTPWDAACDALERSATAYGVGSGSVYRIPAALLDEETAMDRDLAVSMLWTFWQTLADKVRAANAQMSELFSLPSPGQTGQSPRVRLRSSSCCPRRTRRLRTSRGRYCVRISSSLARCPVF